MKIAMFFTVLKAFELQNAYATAAFGFCVGFAISLYATLKILRRERTQDKRANKNEN